MYIGGGGCLWSKVAVEELFLGEKVHELNEATNNESTSQNLARLRSGDGICAIYKNINMRQRLYVGT